MPFLRETNSGLIFLAPNRSIFSGAPPVRPATTKDKRVRRAPPDGGRNGFAPHSVLRELFKSLAWRTRSRRGIAHVGYPEAPLFPNPSRPYTL